MKHIIVSLILGALVALPASASQPTVTIDPTGNVLVGGSNHGAVADVVANAARGNDMTLVAAVQRAFTDFIAKVQVDAAASLAAGVADVEKRFTEAANKADQSRRATLDEAQRKLDAYEAALKKRTERVAQLEAYATDLHAYATALRGNLAGKGEIVPAPPTAP